MDVMRDSGCGGMAWVDETSCFILGPDVGYVMMMLDADGLLDVESEAGLVLMSPQTCRKPLGTQALVETTTKEIVGGFCCGGFDCGQSKLASLPVWHLMAVLGVGCWGPNLLLSILEVDMKSGTPIYSTKYSGIETDFDF